jgi:hypothetical protein
MPQCRGPTREVQIDRKLRDLAGADLANKRLILRITVCRMSVFTNYSKPIAPSLATNLDVWCMLCLGSPRSL